MTPRKIIELTEYKPLFLDKNELPLTVGKMLWQNYSKQIKVDFPSPKTGDRWRLISQGWVGHIPLIDGFQISISPKVEIGNLFKMLEYTYNFKSFHFLEGLINCRTITEFYDQLAEILAKRILNRLRQGLYSNYINEKMQSPFIRGRLELKSLITQPWETKIKCQYQQNTFNIEDNQILLWTLEIILKGNFCQEKTQKMVRQAYFLLKKIVTLKSFSPYIYQGRKYNRLNQDYEILHTLCHFFLTQIAPNHKLGNEKMLPFLVNMAQLYENFITNWLKLHREKILLAKGLDICSQERVYLEGDKSLYFEIDLVIYDVMTGKTKYVLDIKYKNNNKPQINDIYQIIAYATAKKCQEAILIYPTDLKTSLNTNIGNIKIRNVTFSLEGNLEKSGNNFIDNLLNN